VYWNHSSPREVFLLTYIYASHVQAMQAELAEGAPNPSKMTIVEIKGWLMDAGHEAKVWELTQGKAKKADWVAYMRSVV
jgi:hypothetical protein